MILTLLCATQLTTLIVVVVYGGRVRSAHRKCDMLLEMVNMQTDALAQLIGMPGDLKSRMALYDQFAKRRTPPEVIN